jgi:hypothetical protein
MRKYWDLFFRLYMLFAGTFYIYVQEYKLAILAYSAIILDIIMCNYIVKIKKGQK